MSEWATVTDAELVAMNEAGESQRSIGQRYGVTQSQVQRRISRHRGGSSRPVKVWPSARRLADEYEAGCVYRELAERYQMSLSTARRLVRRAKGYAA